MIRRQGALVDTTWEDALARVSDGLQSAHTSLVGLAGGRASNEDLFNFRRLVEGLGHALLHSTCPVSGCRRRAGAAQPGALGGRRRPVVARTCMGAPVWWLRVKQAVERGAVLVVLGARPTRLEKHAAHVLRDTYGDTEGRPRLLDVVAAPASPRAPMDETSSGQALASPTGWRSFGQEARF
jgi:hypothetical protein